MQNPPIGQLKGEEEEGECARALRELIVGFGAAHVTPSKEELHWRRRRRRRRREKVRSSMQLHQHLSARKSEGKEAHTFTAGGINVSRVNQRTSTFCGSNLKSLPLHCGIVAFPHLCATLTSFREAGEKLQKQRADPVPPRLRREEKKKKERNKNWMGVSLFVS